jgi:hypothetical protein
VELPRIRERLLRPGARNDLQPLLEPFPALPHRLVEAVRGRLEKPTAYPEDQTPSAEEVDLGVVFCEPDGVVMRQKRARRANADRRGAMGDIPGDDLGAGRISRAKWCSPTHTGSNPSALA